MKKKQEDKSFGSLGRQSLLPSKNLVELAIPMAIELKLVATSKISETHLLQEVLEKGLEEMQGLFAENEFQLFSRGGELRPATEEEVRGLLPRKIHLRDRSDPLKWVCDTRHVSLKNLTGDPEEVTCKLCRHWVDHPLKQLPPVSSSDLGD